MVARRSEPQSNPISLQNQITRRKRVNLTAGRSVALIADSAMTVIENAHGGFGQWRSAVAQSPGEIRDILMQTQEARGMQSG